MISAMTWPILISFAVVVAWFLGRSKPLIKNREKVSSLSRQYYVGLNYLLNEQPDKAVDVFIKLLEVDSDTVETHLALGSLFRRRGEVDRAIRIHQNLIARPQLTDLQRSEALLALGRDYMGAGVFDRAERIFREVVTLKGGQSIPGLQLLLAIYQQEKSWEKAIATCQKLAALCNDPMDPIIAHHYCELSEYALEQDNPKQAKSFLRQALSSDYTSVRAHLLNAKIAIADADYYLAIKSYKTICKQNPEFISEAVPPLAACYLKLKQPQHLLTFLYEILNYYPRMCVILLIADQLRVHKGLDQAFDFVADHLQRYPSLRGVHQLIEWHFAAADGKLKDKLAILQEITSALLENKPVYQCGKCGYSGPKLHWLCPGCKQWSTIKPIHGLEGD